MYFIIIIIVFSYDVYGNGPNNYMMEPDTSALSLLWSQAPISRVRINFLLLYL